MNMSQKITYQTEFSKDQMNLIAKALTGVLKEREREDAYGLGIKILSEINKLSQERLSITEGALSRGINLKKS